MAGRGVGMRTSQVVVTTTAAKLISGGNFRTGITIFNTDGANRIWIGPAAADLTSGQVLTAANGKSIGPGASLWLEDAARAEIWAISENANVTVEMIEEFTSRPIDLGL